MVPIEKASLPSVDPASPLYVVFTSGSTGTPKGAVISHSNFTSSITYQKGSMGLTSTCRVIDFVSYAFDVAWGTILNTFAAGACLCVPMESERRGDISAAMRRLQVNYAFLTPSIARLLDPMAIPPLQGLLLSGEATELTDLQQWAPHTLLVHAYGPCETTPWATLEPYRRPTDRIQLGVGKGCVTWVVDPNREDQLSPIGCTGELWLEGPIVGLGYFNEVEKTAASFVDTPPWLARGCPGHSPRTGRLYKTGDMVRYNPDGALVFVTRKDAQVKIRGQRVELPEVEYHIHQVLPTNADIPVVAEVITPKGSKSQALVAYLALGDQATGSVDSIRTALGYYTDILGSGLPRALPSYMVPNIYVPVVEIPLTHNGKTDRTQLRRLGSSQTLSQLLELQPSRGSDRAASTSVELALQQLFAEVLNIDLELVGIEDSFFSLGGDSITAMQLSARSQSVDFYIKVADIFKHKTVAQLASHSGSERADVASLSIIEQIDTPFKLSPMQQMFFDFQDAQRNMFNQSFLVHVSRPIQPDRLEDAIERLIMRHTMLRARFMQNSDNVWAQKILSDSCGSFELRTHDIGSLRDARPLLNHSQELLDIESGPIFAANLINTSEDGQFLYLVAHHLVVDLVSWRVLLGDLEEYLVHGRISGYPSLSFQAWCQLQADHARDYLSPGDAFPFEITPPLYDYWGFTPGPGANTMDATVKHSFVLEKSLTDLLLGPANSVFNTQPVEILHAALLHSFTQSFSDRASPTIFTEGHGREAWDSAIDLSRTVGWFTTVFPVVAAATKDDKMTDIVRRTKDCRRQIPGNGRPYFASRYLNSDGQEAFRIGGPVEIIFNYLGQYQQLERPDALFQQSNVSISELADAAPHVSRFALIDVAAYVTHGQLQVEFLYNRNLQHRSKIEGWIAKCEQSLTMAAHELPLLSPTYTICDFPLMSLTEASLEFLVSEALPAHSLSYGQIEDVYPCSPIQQGILMSQAKDPELYWTRVRWLVQPTGPSPVDCPRLERAWQRVVDRHPILRTVFIDSVRPGGVKDQVVVKAIDADVQMLQTETLTDPVTGCQWHTDVASKRDSPQHALTLSQSTSGTVFCDLEINHAMMDAYSLGLLRQELCAVYTGSISPTAGPSYEAYVRYIQSLPVDSDKDFWMGYLRDVPVCNFPALGQPELANSNARQSVFLDLDDQTHLALRKFCQQSEITPSSIFHLAWGLVLRAYTGLETVCFGYLTSGRDIPIPGVERALGPFINMLVCRLNLGQPFSIMKTLQQDQEDYIAALEYQHTPLARILQFSGQPGQGLFNTGISVQGGIVPPSTESEISFIDQTGQDSPEYDIAIAISHDQDATSLALDFTNAVLSKDGAEQIAALFQQAVVEVIDYPEQSARDVNLMSPRHVEDIWSWNAHVAEPVKACVHDLIERQAHLRPQAAAINAWDGDLTYKELNHLSTRLARHLVDLGVCANNDAIPLCFEKSMWMSIAALAVMKAGGTCVALDTTQPEERLRAIVHDIEPSLVLSSHANHKLAKGLTDTHVLPIEQSLFSQLPVPDTGNLPAVAPSSPLYVVFTSGSTGKPKGTTISHTNFASAIIHQPALLALDPDARVFDFVSYAFDVAWSNMLHTLAAGACLCVPSESVRRDGTAEALEAMQVTHVQFTPSMARTIDPNQVKSLTTLILGGEPLSKQDIATWAPRVNLRMAYGPAECTVAATMTAVNLESGQVGKIGRGIGLNTWVVGEAGLAPVGAVGELWLEGPLVGLGYRGEPEKTAASFVEDPGWLLQGSSLIPGRRGRLYRTGDLVRYNSDGSLVYVGRKDSQVKVRGQRVELEEIEFHLHAALSQAVEAVVEVIKPLGSANAMLVAYLNVGRTIDSSLESIHAAMSPYTAGLADALSQKLPQFMVPTTYVPIAEIPMTISGKTDRRRLRDMGSSLNLNQLAQMQPTQGQRQLPQTEAELQLQKLWAEVLNIDQRQIGTHDSFFSLGGDSISAMQLSAKSRSAGLRVTVPDIFKLGTIAKIAPSAISRTEQQLLDWESKEDESFELSPIQQMFFDTAKSNHFNQSFFIRITRSVQSEDIQRTLKIVVAEHAMLRARFDQDADEHWTQRIVPYAPDCYRYERHCVRTLSEASQILDRSQLSLDIHAGPVFSVDLIDTSTQGQYLFLVAHHLAVDLVSWRIILGDMEEHLTTSKVSGFKPLPFLTWTRLQAEYARDQLVPKTAFPVEIPAPQDYWGLDPAINTFENTVHSTFSLSKEVTDSLLGPANQALDTQPVEILQAALLHSFIRTFQDRPAPTIFSEGHGREPWDSAIDLSRTVGWFTTMSPTVVPASVENEDTLYDIVRRTKDGRRQVPANGWPYFTSRYLNDDGRKVFGGYGLPEVTFNYMGLYQQLERHESLFAPANPPECSLSDVANEMGRFALIEVMASVSQGRLEFGFMFNRHMKHSGDIPTWIAQYESSLQTAAQELPQRPPSYTLCDFPLLSLTEPALQKLNDHILPHLRLAHGLVEDIYPLTPIQQGILLSQAKSPHLYWTRIRWLIRPSRRSPSVSIDRIVQAWKRVVSRHPALRTVFVESLCPHRFKDQLVMKASEPEIHLISSSDPPAALTSHWESKAHVHKPLHSLVLCPTPSGDGIFCDLEMNHAITDATSTALLKREICASYDNMLPDTTGPLYSDYIRHIQSVSVEASVNYWKEYLEGVNACLFPSLCEPSEGRKSRGSTTRSLDRETHSILRAFCQQNGFTPANLFQLAWALILRCYTGSDTVCFGYLMSGRDVPVEGADRTIGPFINLLVSRIHLGNEESLVTMMQQNQADFVSSLNHQHSSLAQILRSSGASADTLFNTVLSVQGMGLKACSDDDEFSLRLDEQDGYDPTEYDIMLNVGLGGEDTAVTFTYHQSLLSEQQAESLVQSLLQAVVGIIRSPAKTAAQVDLAGHRDQELIWSWNATVPPTIDATIHGLIADQVRQRPDAQAICAWDGEFTYRELDGLSTRLALHLGALGVGANSIVPLVFEKTRWMPVSALAVMKAGGASVAMDATQPPERLRVMVQQVQPALLLSSRDNYLIAQTLGAQMAVAIDDMTLSDISIPSNLVCPSVDPSQTLYVVFTSGSTGTPKGVVVSHSDMSNSILYQQEAISFGPNVRLFDFVSYAWDVTWCNLLHPLVAGGCLCIPHESQRRADIEKAMCQFQVNYVTLTPTVARLLNPVETPCLDTLALVGEPLLHADVVQWAPHAHEILNTYSPSECPGADIVFQVPRNYPRDPPLGTAVGCNTWVVDPTDVDRLVPVGGIGELCLEGPMVARGYLGLPERTAQSFVENPSWLRRGSPGFSGRQGRVYCTGDLVRYNSDGLLFYVGRKDGQVKIRGQRVELGEVESHVRQGIHDVDDGSVLAAVIKPQGSNNPMLVCFLGLGEVAAASTDQVRAVLADRTRGLDEYLARRLPRFMVPSAYIPVVDIPMTVSGKTDRSRLVQAAASRTLAELAELQPSRGARQAPTTDMEWLLQGLWAAVLGLDASMIAADDSFLRIGGDSIAAIRLGQRASDEGLSLAVPDIFANPRLCDMALCLREGRSSYHNPRPFSLLSLPPSSLPSFLESSVLPLLDCPQTQISDVYPTTELQDFYVSSALDARKSEIEHIYMDLPVGADIALVRQSCVALWQHLDILRTVFIVDGHRQLQVVLNPDEPDIVIHEAHGDLAACAEVVYRRDLDSPLEQGRSFTRFFITHTPGGGIRLTIRLSHAQYDGFSMPLIFSCFAAFYRGESPAPEPKFSGYIRHVQQQQQTAHPYWRSLLENSSITPVKSLSAVDGRCLPNQHVGGMIQAKKSIPAPQPRQGLTPATVFTTLCARMLAKVADATDVVFGQIVSGRASLPATLQNVAGPCVNTIPVRVRVTPSQVLEQQLDSVHEQHIKGLPYENSQFGDIAAHCTNWPVDSRTPELVVQFQNLDNMEHDAGTSILEAENTLAAYMREGRPIYADFIFILAKPVGESWNLSVIASSKFHTQHMLNVVLEELEQEIANC
ncbi:acetyl-CoA synthetase-like protein [Aspergillus steynii IBT 23096]|uniref:Acetyl-CoA synthetase-like protein n=1 Tax=Aspergillus steynii IBT 23096 TaxID=1392250 RepID=A0A2I2G2R4_9EURO|nr:acetyl-CoA synthetase-like protein [Aspergillus steynii IBT 23096]PLB47169.1 acetyl-CoA synthetase-like protein [Aspergillus steynii IBT 23096]